jgi:putative selenium metabolism hydrolase
MTELFINVKDCSNDLLAFAQDLVRIKSFSGDEGLAAQAIASKMRALDYDDVRIDSMGNVLGRIGSGEKSILFEAHMDTVQVHDAEAWAHAPFSGAINGGLLWGRGSADMKAGLAAAVFAAAAAKSAGTASGKTIYVSCTVAEEDCDGEGVKNLLHEFDFKPQAALICEPSNNIITLGHKGKAQIIVKTMGISAHGSAPEKGVNAVYEMAGIIQRVEQTNRELMKKEGRKGTLALARISSTAVSLNAVPSECEIYLDRRMAPGETEETIRAEMEKIVAGKDAVWEVDTVRRTSWTGAPITYRPLHPAWEIDLEHSLTQACIQACHSVFGSAPEEFSFWDFSTNAVALVSAGIPCIGFGPGEPKMAHMRDENCAVSQILDACAFYAQVIAAI